MRMLTLLVTALAILAAPPAAHAQYNAAAGENAPKGPAAADRYGNAAGSQNDLAIDGAFDGQTVVVLHFYTGEGFDFSLPDAALKQKGFTVSRFVNRAPTPEVLRAALAKASE